MKRFPNIFYIAVKLIHIQPQNLFQNVKDATFAFYSGFLFLLDLGAKCDNRVRS